MKADYHPKNGPIKMSHKGPGNDGLSATPAPFCRTVFRPRSAANRVSALDTRTNSDTL